MGRITLQEWRPDVTGGTLMGRSLGRAHPPFNPVNDDKQQHQDQDDKEITKDPDYLFEPHLLFVSLQDGTVVPEPLSASGGHLMPAQSYFVLTHRISF